MSLADISRPGTNVFMQRCYTVFEAHNMKDMMPDFERTNRQAMPMVQANSL
jgi:hypothetical protein